MGFCVLRRPYLLWPPVLTCYHTSTVNRADHTTAQGSTRPERCTVCPQSVGAGGKGHLAIIPGTHDDITCRRGLPVFWGHQASLRWGAVSQGANPRSRSYRRSMVCLVLLRGTIVNRTYGTHKNLYIHPFFSKSIWSYLLCPPAIAAE